MATEADLAVQKGIFGFLSQASSFADGQTSVKLIETHISWVFLTDRYAYKLKKPVRFEFVDFSSPELRHRACQEELRLNRRFAPDVYLAVLPVTQDSNGSVTLDGAGREVDWIVQMRRLPAENAVDVILREHRLTPEYVSLIAKYLSDFYARLSPKAIRPDKYRAQLDHHIRANTAALLASMPGESSRLQRIHSAQLRYINVQSAMLARRVTDGRIVDGHGDLRPEHIYVDGRPIVIDCLEFSEELRTVDIADELSFLAMECERLGDGGLGAAVLTEYQTKCRDDLPDSLLAFYRCYRALVRAKVATLRDQQQVNKTRGQFARLVCQYVDLADRYAAKLGPPAIVLVGGLMGTGKSTLAAKLADAFGVEVISTDHIRRSLLGASAAPANFGEGNYQPDLRSRVYDIMFQRAERILLAGQSVVLDGTFLKGSLRERAYDLAQRNGAASLHVFCTCPRKKAVARIERRAEAGQSDSEARVELFDRQARELELPHSDEPAVTVDTMQPPAQQLRLVFDTMHAQIFARAATQKG